MERLTNKIYKHFDVCPVNSKRVGLLCGRIDMVESLLLKWYIFLSYSYSMKSNFISLRHCISFLRVFYLLKVINM